MAGRSGFWAGCQPGAWPEYGRKPPRGLTVDRLGATTTPWFDYWLATPDELAAAVAESAWTLEALDHDPNGPGYIARLRC
ncbi:hypothetical protein E1292_15575 [Nonomuraea deserti]|uniref:Uncharacterized protein n=1 Tax=Nonomuraea deserti TaxID=1848322 RepID=A0A4R4VMK9_9ACTN|nr:hypothetical protein [Nonomuraea deserti]TDD06301.1 hypothetical protein E1292_15575 [Nonomuraea deserti]